VILRILVPIHVNEPAIIATGTLPVITEAKKINAAVNTNRAVIAKLIDDARFSIDV
jgi:hypothetical protein